MRILVSCMLLLGACQLSSPTKINTENQKADNSIDSSNFNFTHPKIDDNIQSLSLNEETLFGQFHQDRVEFHIVEQPNLSLYQAGVQQLTLYFFDGLLCGKKYELNTDVSNYLISEFGSFTFKPLDWETRDLAKVVSIVLSNDSIKIINPVFNKYQVKWELEDKTIFFTRENDSENESNIYEEQLPVYRLLLNSVEKDLI